MSAAVILDTDVVSFLFKGDTRAEAYRIDFRRQDAGIVVYDRC